MKTKNVSRWQLVIITLAVGIAGSIAVGFGFADNPPRTFYVSTTGSDTNIGNQAAPFQTIAKGLASATSGDIILINSGVYHEALNITHSNDAGITLRGIGATKPVIDGDNVRSYGILLSNGANNVTIDNFEIRNIASTSSFAAGIQSSETNNSRFINNDIHDVHTNNDYAYGIDLGNNGSPGLVHDNLIKDNKIHDIGPGGESQGIWLVYNKDTILDGNEIYKVRKEGIRDWGGLDNQIINNVVYLTFVGIEPQTNIGARVANNVSYDNVYNYNVKHANNQTLALDRWGLSSPSWVKFWHNTSYGATYADITTGMNPPTPDYIDISNNLFVNASDVHVQDFPLVHGTHLKIDGNAYSGDSPLMSTDGWTLKSFLTDLTAMKTRGYETHGQYFTPTFKDPSVGDFRFNEAGLNPAENLGDNYGTQVGARQTKFATNRWESYPATVIASTPMFTANSNKQNASDGSDKQYWYGAANAKTAQITMDLGSTKAINMFMLDIYSHKDNRTPKTMKIEVSNDNSNYTTALDVTNQDDLGSSYKYQLPNQVNARYVRLSILNNFEGSNLVFADFRSGLLTPITSTSPNNPPSISITTPADNTNVDAPGPVTIEANASDNDGQIKKVEFFKGTTKIGEDLTAPFSFAWYGLTDGSYAITATATDDDGAQTTSAPINLTVKAAPAPPPTPTCTRDGDINCDDKVDYRDLSYVLSKVNTADSKADFNHDGIINYKDLSYILSKVQP